MPLQRPTLATLRDRTVTDLRAALRLSGSLGPYLSAIGHAVAGAAHGLYGYIDYIGQQMTPATAEGAWLEHWASLWKYARKPAATAGGTITLSGTTGANVPSVLYLQSSDGAMYATTAGGTIGGVGTLDVPVVANESGAAGNAAAGTALTLVSPAAGIDSSATVAAGGITGGRDIETDDELRARLIQRISNPAHGGAKADYELWALEVPGITRAWCVPRYNGDGSVRVYVGEADPQGATVASAALVAEALTYIEEQRPVSYSDLSVLAPTIQAQDIQINALPNTAETHAAVEAELAALFSRDAEPEGSIFISRINEAISIAAGESDHTLISPTADPQATAGNILTLGTVTFV